MHRNVITPSSSSPWRAPNYNEPRMLPRDRTYYNHADFKRTHPFAGIAEIYCQFKDT